jgi:hypothetical protein
MKSVLKNVFAQVKLFALAILYIEQVRLTNWMARNGLMLGANTLTSLIPSLYEALDIVSRELVGAIPCATLDASVSRAAVGQTVTSFITPSAAATDITPGVTPPNDGDQTIGNVGLTITKSRRVPFRWNGEEELGLNNNGSGARPIKNAQLQQAIRTLVNEMESDVVTAARVAASRAYGTAGTTPFATNLADPAQIRKILDDNGAPPSDRCVVIDTTAGAAMRTLGQLTKANEAGTTMTLRDGELLNIHGMSFHESAQVTAVTKGTGTSYTTNTAGYAVGATAITLITGSGTILAGDIITFNGDSNKYVVTGALSGGVVTIGAPGLRQAIPTSATAVTVGGNFTPNVAFSQSSLILATRAPALPEGGDMAVDRTMIVDPRSGIAFEVAMYAQYRQMQYEISAAWGCKGIKPNHCAILLG